MPTLNLNTGKGITFIGNKMATNYENNGNISIRSNGLYIPNLSGSSGTSGGEVSIDNNYIVPSGSGVKTSRAKVQYIFSMCAYRVLTRTRNNYTIDTDNLKTAQNILTEFNAKISDRSTTAYNIAAGDLLMFRSKPHPIQYWPLTESTVDDGNRYTSDDCLALFVVNDVYKNPGVGLEIVNFTLECLYSNLVSLGLSAGEIIQWPDI